MFPLKQLLRHFILEFNNVIFLCRAKLANLFNKISLYEVGALMVSKHCLTEVLLGRLSV